MLSHRTAPWTAASVFILELMASGAAAQSTTFGSPQVLTASGGPKVYATDLDGDGDVDILSGNAWHENLGGGVFGIAQGVTSTGCSIVYATDLDGDGDVDILANFGGGMAYFVNAGNGQFSGPVVIAPSSTGANYAADLDGDGDIDILSGSAWYENLGFGFFGAAQNFWTFTYPAESAYAADLDMDGDKDLVTWAPNTPTSWYENQGSGTFGPAQALTSNSSWASALHIADLDRDGDPDVLVARSGFMSGHIAWAENQGGGVFGIERLIYVTTSLPFSSMRSLDAADLDGDGDVDAIAAESPWSHITAWYENLLSPTVASTAAAYGIGCGSPPMDFAPTSTAVISTAIAGIVSNTPTPICVIAMGWSDTAIPGVGPLPFNLDLIGMTGCQLWQSSEVFGLSTQGAGQLFVVTFSYPVPNAPNLLGSHIYTQAFSYAPGANSLGIIASNGIDWFIGNQ